MATYLFYDGLSKLKPGNYVRYSTVFNEPARLAVVHSVNPNSVQLISTDNPVPKTIDAFTLVADGSIELLDDQEAIDLFNVYRAGMGAFSQHIRIKEREKGLCK